MRFPKQQVLDNPCGNRKRKGRDTGTGTDGGFTLTESLIVVAIAVTLAGLAGLQFSVWMDRYNIEREIRELHSELMGARARAMMRNRFHFVILSETGYIIREDVAPWPDGDGDLNGADDTRPSGYAEPIPLIQRSLNVRYPITWNGSSSQIDFNTRGAYNSAIQKTICSKTLIDADYNCISLTATRILLGTLVTPGGPCNKSNCTAR